MRTLRILAALALGGPALFGCQQTISNLANGEPVIDDAVWLHGPAVQAPAAASAPSSDAFLPDACNKDWSSATMETIAPCTEAMKQLIDVRFAHYEDSLLRAIDAGNTTADIGVVGLGLAGTLSPGVASQILNAISAGITSTKSKVNEDILYNKSIELILVQMDKDRASWASVIETRLKPGSANEYTSMYQAANDLYAYDRAGSWTQALISMQTDSGAENSACQNELKTVKKTGATVAPAAAQSTNCKNSPASGTDTTGSTSSFTVTFRSGTALIDPASQQDLASAEAAIKASKSGTVTLTGQSTAAETKADAALAGKRATAVQIRLIGSDILPSQITVAKQPNLNATSPSVLIQLVTKPAAGP